MIIILLVLIILTSTVVYVVNNYNYKNIYFATALDESYLKDLNITLEPTQIIPKVSKNKIRNIAINMLKKSYSKPKGVYLEYGLITDKNRSINVFPKDILEANPALKENTYINQIPVWLITFKGILPDDYKNNYDSKTVIYY